MEAKLRRSTTWRIAAVLALALIASWAHAAQDRQRYPNIVVILVDDLGYGDVRANYGDSKIATPNIDELAARGMRFTDAHSGAAVCSATRYGVLTGQNFSRLDWSRIEKQLSESMIDDDRLTLPEFLQANGYHTGAFGKWHLGQTFFLRNGNATGPNMFTDWSRPMKNGPNDRGFDEYYGVLFSHAQTLLGLVSNRLVEGAPSESENGWAKVKGYNPVEAIATITNHALEYIDWNARERPGKPFFLYFPTIPIHEPLLPSPEFQGMSGIGPYGDLVMEVDSQVGKVVSRLKLHDMLENTLIIFTSDNGSHGRAGNDTLEKFPYGSVQTMYGHNMNGNWRGLKGSMYEGGHRVPFIASWPGHIEYGSVSNQLISLDDLMATFAAIIGVELPKGSAEDSYNILPYLDGTHRGPPIREYAVISTFNGDPVLRKGKWVLSFTLGPGTQFTSSWKPIPGGPQGQLYNLEDDPGETTNVWLQYPEVVDELTKFYQAHVARGSSFGIDR
jgi:arylsulfatase A-like enzyme